jgi:hypothetical protein
MKQTATPRNSHKRQIKNIVHRSAVTGKFVSAAYAKRYPKKTIRQIIWRDIDTL